VLSSRFNAKVAMAAAKEDKTLSVLAGQFGVHGNQVSAWKKTLVTQAAELFEDGRPKSQAGPGVDKLFAQIGRLQVELEWLKKKESLPVEVRRGLVDFDHAEFSVRRQCELLGLARSSCYYEAVAESAENLRVVRQIDGQCLKTPSSMHFRTSRPESFDSARQGPWNNLRASGVTGERRGVSPTVKL